jgi:hypothetical protein
MDPDGIWGIEIFVRRSGGSVRVDEVMAMPYLIFREKTTKLNHPKELILIYYTGFSHRP